MRVVLRSASTKENATADRMSHFTAAVVRSAQSGDDKAKLNLLLRFQPLCRRCAAQAHQATPFEEKGVLECEVECEFLILLHEFDPQRGVPFDGFISVMLPQRVLAWTRKERLHRQRETPLSQMRGEEQQTDPLEEDADRIIRLHGDTCFASFNEQEDFALLWQQVAPLLTVQQRKVMELVLQGLTECAIAERLGINSATAHRLKDKACKKLKKHW